MLMSSKLCQENQCSSSRRFLLDNFLLDLVIVPDSYKMRGKEEGKEVQCMTNELVLQSNIKLEGLEQALNIRDYKLGRWNVHTVKQEGEPRKDLLLTGFCCTNMFCSTKANPSSFHVSGGEGHFPKASEPNLTSRSSAAQEWLFPCSGVVGLAALRVLSALPILRRAGPRSRNLFHPLIISALEEFPSKERKASPHGEMLQCQCRDFSPWCHEDPQVL